MRRAPLCLTIAALALLASFPRPSAGSSVIDGTTMVDFTRAPDFKVGSWVHYRSASSSLLGYHSDYELWLLVAGEEEFWGERCFWLETWTLDHGADTVYTASLVSYAAFGDSASLRHPLWFMRKEVRGLAADGSPDVNIPLRDRNELRMASSARGHRSEEEQTTVDHGFDSLAVDTCRLPVGLFRGHGVKEVTRTVQEVMRGDSTVHYEHVETRVRKLDSRIPITRMAREDVDDIQFDDVWLTGESGRSTRRVLEDARGVTVLVGYGDHGLMPRVVNRMKAHVSGRMLRRVTPTGSEAVGSASPGGH